MANPIHIIKAAFSGGEFAPSLWGRVDIQKYASGARKLLNFFVHPHGGISNRPGTHMVSAALFNNKKVRLIPFSFASDESYVVEFGDHYCRFFNNDQLTSNATVTMPYAEADLPLIKFTQSADVLFIVHPDYQPRMLERTNSTTFVLANYDFLNGPFQLANVTTQTMQLLTLSSASTLVSSAAFFNTDMVGGLMQLEHYIEGQSLTQAFTSATTSTSISCGGTWRVISHGTWVGKFRVEKSTDNGTTWLSLRQFSSGSTSSSADLNVDTYGSEDMSDGALPFLVRARMTSYTSGTLNVDLDTDPFYAKSIAKMQTYTNSTTMQVLMQRLSLSTATTTDWAEGAWSDYRGWPHCVTFCQDRLIFANNYNQPQTIWMSQTGNYYDFYVNSPLVYSDSISINLPSQQLNEINGMVASLKLIVFSTGAEWSVGAEQSGILSPTTISVIRNSSTGSAGVDPVTIVNRAIYVQARGAVVRDLGYDIFTNTFTGANLSILSNHLFFNYNIVEWAYQQDPDSLVWAVRDDGVLLSMTYMREQEVLAWTQHNTYNGDDLFESVCSIPGVGYNEIWFSINRGGQRYIERMDQRLASNLLKDQFFVDSGITQDATTSTVVNSSILLSSHFDGVQGVTTYQAETGGTITFVGDSILDTSNFKFGTASLLLNNYDYATIPATNVGDIGAGDFTIECQTYIDTLDFGLSGDDRVDILSNNYYDSSYNGNWSLNITSTNAIQFSTYDKQSNHEYIQSADGIILSGTWYHFSVVRNGATTIIYVNGVNVASGAIVKTLGDTNGTIAFGNINS